MFAGGQDSVNISWQRARYIVALGFVLLSVTVTGAALGSAAAQSQSGPVEISDWTALDNIRTDTDADYVLVADLNETTPGYETVAGPNANAGKGFNSISGFAGNFDGQGNTIANLTIARPNEDNVGLFANTSEGAEISEVRVTDATVTGSGNVGGLVGFNEGAVRNASASGTVTGSSIGVGGLVGDNRGTVSNASASGTVTGSSVSVGGLVGSSVGGVRNASASATVDGIRSVGGLVGRNFAVGEVSNSRASGAVDGSGNVGGLVGRNYGTVSGVSARGTVSGSIGVGGLVGRNAGRVRNASTSGAVDGSNDVGGLVGRNRAGVNTASASGSVNGSVRVGGLVGNNEREVRDASASGTVTGSQGVGGLVGQNEGTVRNASASGTVNGTSAVGGLVGRSRNGTVSTASASGNVTGTGAFGTVGGLVGDMSLGGGTVRNASASGTVTGTGEFGTVGGLVGDMSLGGTVSNASASGAVTGSTNVGGLVGFIRDGTVSESFATGVVTGSTDVGGLVGQLGVEFSGEGEETILRDSYYDTQTTGQQAAVGTIVEGNGTAERRGEVAGLPTSQMQGASAAQNMAALDFTSTWQVVTDPPGYPKFQSLPPLTATFNVTPEDPTAGEQLTFDADFSTPESDIESYGWTLDDGTTATGKQITHTYTDSGQFTVELTVQSSTVTDTATETITVSPRVEISNWTDLDDIRTDTDADYVLVTDLNETTPGYETVAGPNANGGKGFDPIGGFNGSFDGQGNTIANLTIDRRNEDNVGLFGRTSEGAAIEEVRLRGATVTGLVSVGGLVGQNAGAVSTASASGTVTGSNRVGGLVGQNDGTVSTASVSGTVTGFDRVGGLVGQNNGTVRNASASGAVDGSNRVGGLVGDNRETVSTASASGNVTGSDSVGGLVGSNFDTVRNTSASGAVDGSDSVGGLVGGNSDATVSESFAAGVVTGSSDVGGLVGQLGFEFSDPGDEAILRDSYYDTQATGQQAAVGTVREGNGIAERRGEVAGLSTSQMQGASATQNMGALEFTSTWQVVTDPPGYPELSTVPTLGRNPPRDSDGDGFNDNDSSNESGSNGDDSGGENETNESGSDGSGPGFGIVGALAGLGGAGYLLKRRLDDENRK